MLKIKLTAWGIQRIFQTILFVPLTLCMLMGLAMKTVQMLGSVSSIALIDIQAELFYLVFSVAGSLYSYTLVSPKQQQCMEAVKDFLSYKTLKRCIRNEVFEEPITFYDQKGSEPQYMSMYISKYWVCIGENYFGKITSGPQCIPRHMIELVYVRRGKIVTRNFQGSSFAGYRGQVLTIVTKAGDQLSIGYIKDSEAENTIGTLSTYLGMPIYQAADNEAFQFYAQTHDGVAMKKEFSAQINSEQEFLDFVYQ